ncbi:MAG: D-alanyl-D-alanine carboxypeptidase [Verrucomicrobia bacterium]|nr:D-alanyl-D-alanine carboxypeptidase [Verrucomicrobiota bacterium]
MKRFNPLLTFSTAALLLAGCATHRAPQKGAEDLSAPPPVTAKAWAIADGRTGNLLWGYNADEPRKSASTTKMMCAFVVLELAEKNPAVLDERITFSKLAGTTGGSTAAVKPGESLTIRDCLRGLLLPSGNDAGNALAEHFNARLKPPDGTMRKFGLDSTNLVTRVNFIAEMNRTARRLGLKDTKYRSSFGDGGTENDRTTTVRDLTRLAWTAMQNPRFREIVATRRYEGDVRTPDGGTRKAVWENSNELLGLDAGYDGVKTGTTIQAGTCLVSRGHRDGDQLIIATLGSESEKGRYVDTRNLFRWAWMKRGHR